MSPITNITNRNYSPIKWGKIQHALQIGNRQKFHRLLTSCFSLEERTAHFSTLKILIDAKGNNELKIRSSAALLATVPEMPLSIEDLSSDKLLLPSEPLSIILLRHGIKIQCDEGTYLANYREDVAGVIDREWENNQLDIKYEGKNIFINIGKVDNQASYGDQYNRIRSQIRAAFDRQKDDFSSIGNILLGQVQKDPIIGMVFPNYKLLLSPLAANLLDDQGTNGHARSFIDHVLSHEYGHINLFNMSGKQYRRFRRINHYRHSIISLVRKIYCVFKYNTLSFVRSLLKQCGLSFTLRMLSRNANSIVLHSKKKRSDYITFFSMTDISEDYAEQYATFRNNLEYFERRSKESEILRNSLSFFKALYQ